MVGIDRASFGARVVIGELRICQQQVALSGVDSAAIRVCVTTIEVGVCDCDRLTRWISSCPVQVEVTAIVAAYPVKEVRAADGEESPLICVDAATLIRAATAELSVADVERRGVADVYVTAILPG